MISSDEGGDTHSSCQCSQHISLLSIGLVSSTVISVLIIIFTSVIIVLIRDKVHLKEELNICRSEAKSVYEEIEPVQSQKQSSLDYNTQDNTAYGLVEQTST